MFFFCYVLNNYLSSLFPAICRQATRHTWQPLLTARINDCQQIVVMVFVLFIYIEMYWNFYLEIVEYEKHLGFVVGNVEPQHIISQAVNEFLGKVNMVKSHFKYILCCVAKSHQVHLRLTTYDTLCLIASNMLRYSCIRTTVLQIYQLHQRIEQ